MRTLLVVLAVLCCGPDLLCRAQPPGERDDSIDTVLGLGGDTSSQRELSGQGIAEFRFYTTTDRSVILWTVATDFYVYSISGTGHESRAQAVLGLLATHGLESFLAETRPFAAGRAVRFHHVLALQVRAAAGGAASGTATGPTLGAAVGAGPGAAADSPARNTRGGQDGVAR